MSDKAELPGTSNADWDVQTRVREQAVEIEQLRAVIEARRGPASSLLYPDVELRGEKP